MTSWFDLHKRTIFAWMETLLRNYSYVKVSKQIYFRARTDHIINNVSKSKKKSGCIQPKSYSSESQRATFKCTQVLKSKK